MQYDFIVIGSGMGGLAAASLLAKEGYRVLMLEASYVPGGCASSYVVKRDGQRFVFEAGATTIVGLDEHQPLYNLARELGIEFPVVELNPSMTVHIGSKRVVRYKDKDRWIAECYHRFFEGAGVSFRNVRRFWRLVFHLSDFVWKVSERNRAFPPNSFADVLELWERNRLADFPKLLFLFRSAYDVIKRYGLDASRDFLRFCDEQLMITAQAASKDVSFLYAAPCLAYANSSNYYAYGGIIKLAETILSKYASLGGDILYREPVKLIERAGDGGFKVTTETGKTFKARNVVSNATIWNMAYLTKGRISQYFQRLSRKFKFAWGAFTMSVAVKDEFPQDLTLHHQFILDQKIPLCESDSFFVSLSMPDDYERQPKGVRLLAISTHSKVERWIEPNPNYDAEKRLVAEFILSELEKRLPGFKRENVVFQNASTPKSWQDWTYRRYGRVGGIPNVMSRKIWELVGAETPFKGLYLVGDTVYPGQGIAGACLSGQNAVYRVKRRAANLLARGEREPIRAMAESLSASD
ncbi:MAG: NAD(P)/FAD-dependent oxidoreductase [Chloroherpetonaceae bacterium]|nr:NAD(P)/FAD-dependent oxidoreductase [Chloroherpetonaceae bacterium]MDW8436747.1 NAD(P)/FAD-dependent oxidoreductase [Chloroherpetonaceae bacterium]